MTRYTDALFFGFLFALDAVAWLILWLTGSLPTGTPNTIAPMTVSVIIVIASPALAAIALLALGRAWWDLSPRSFWTWVASASILMTLTMAAAMAITLQMQLQLGFATGAWFMLVTTICAVLALFLGVIGAISRREQASEPEPEPVLAADVSSIEETPVFEQIAEEKD